MAHDRPTNAEALERFEKVDTLVVDKTGTLTEGKPRVVAVVPAEGFDEVTVLSLGASLERSSEHPLAAAILKMVKERGLALQDVTDFKSVTGKGVTGNVAGRQVAIGNAKFLNDIGVASADLETRARDLQRGGATGGLHWLWAGAPAASSRSPTRSRPPHRLRSRSCVRTASVSSC